ncbi:MAG: hypothetical protein ABSF23_08405 [Terracidiphilus sp.]
MDAAIERMITRGGSLGEHLVAIGAIEERVLDAFLCRVPEEPADLAATGISETDLLALLMKHIFSGRLEKVGQIADAIRLPQHLVMDLARTAIERQLLYTLGSQNSDSMLDMRYALTEEGKRWTIDALERSGYIGPAPVTLEEFVARVERQKPTRERITMDRVVASTSDLTIDDSVLDQSGPALNSGRAILLYGPPGNGKTSVAMRYGTLFTDVIHVPHAIMVEGQIIRFFDPRIHVPAAAAMQDDPNSAAASFRRQTHDRRWVACKRPFVVAGGELTLDMLDLRYDSTGHYYEAPLHMKALCGMFLIDDFGRQFVKPKDLLNRWIVPMENRVDYLKLRNGASFTIPFEEIVIFATNLDPEDLMDSAFLRRIPYKIEVPPPAPNQFRRILDRECERHGMAVNRETVNYIMYLITKEKGLGLAGYQPGFIVEQVVATCRFLEKPPELKSPYIEYAINNLRVKRNAEPRAERNRRTGSAAGMAEAGVAADTTGGRDGLGIEDDTEIG